eukprot:IDg11718t1
MQESTSSGDGKEEWSGERAIMEASRRLIDAYTFGTTDEKLKRPIGAAVTSTFAYTFLSLVHIQLRGGCVSDKSPAKRPHSSMLTEHITIFMYCPFVADLQRDTDHRRTISGPNLRIYCHVFHIRHPSLASERNTQP